MAAMSAGRYTVPHSLACVMLTLAGCTLCTETGWSASTCASVSAASRPRAARQRRQPRAAGLQFHRAAFVVDDMRLVAAEHLAPLAA